MVEHIVLFKWADTASNEAITAAIEGLRALKDKIPGILELTVGENFSNRSQGFTHALYVRFTNREALEVYAPHPEHQAVVQNLIAPIKENVLAVDYEV